MAQPGFKVDVEASLGFNGVVAAIDETALVTPGGNGLRVLSTGDWTSTALWSPAVGGSTAFAANANAKLVALASGGEEPAISLFSWPSPEPAARLTGGTDLQYTAVAISRDGSRVAGFGSVPEFHCTLWDTGSGVPLKGGDVKLPAAVTAASFDPSSPNRMAASGASGLFIVSVTPSFDTFDLKVVTAELVAAPELGSAEVEPGVLGVLETAAAAAAAAGSSSTLPHSAAAAATAATASKRGGNNWLCHAWLDGSWLVACNAAGYLAVVSAADGKLAATYHLATTLGAPAGTTAAAVAVLKNQVALGCSDGVVRFVSLSAATVAAKEAPTVVRAVALTATAPALPHGTPAAPTAATGAAGAGVLAVTSIAVTPSYTTAYIGTAAGTLHCLTVGPAAAAAAAAADAPHTAAAVVDDHAGSVLTAVSVATPQGSSVGECLTLTAGSDGTLRLWSASPSPSASHGGHAKRARALSKLLLAFPAHGGASALVHVSAVAAHRRLPLVAVGGTDGSVTVLAVTAAAAAAQLAVVYRDCSHTGAVTSVAFSDEDSGYGGGASRPVLLSVAADALAVVHDVSAAVHRKGHGGHAPADAAVGFARLPQGQDTAVTAVAWAGPTVFLGCASGHLLSLSLAAGTLPATAPAADLTSHLKLRGRMISGILSLVAARPASAAPGAHVVLVASLVGEKALALFNVAADGSDAHALPGAHDALMAVHATAAPHAINAHRKSAACLAISPLADSASSFVVASGGSDGALTLLAVTASHGSVSVSGSAHTLMHAAPITRVAFSPNGRTVVAISALERSGGCGHVMAVSGAPAAQPKLAPALAQAEAGIAAAAAAAAEAGDSFTASGSVDLDGAAAPVLVRAHRAAEAAVAAEHAAVHATLLAELQTFRDALAKIVAANDAAPALEKLDRKEIVVDAAGADAVVAAYDSAAQGRRAAYAEENARLDAELARLRAECVEAVEAQACEVHALASDFYVRNFAIRKRGAAESALLAKVALLRAVEKGSMEGDRDVEDSKQGPVWGNLSSRIPADTDWLYHTGLLAPTTEPGKQLEGLLSAKASGKPATGPGGAAAAATGAASGAASPTADGKEGEGEGGGSGEGGAGGGEGGEGEEDKGLQWEGEAVIHWLYHPASVRTSAQKRTQIALLKELIRASQAKFNAAFDKLKNEKHEAVDAIRARHARLRDILTELGTPVVHMTEKDSKAEARAVHMSGEPVAAAVLVAAGLTSHGHPLAAAAAAAAASGGGAGAGAGAAPSAAGIAAGTKPLIGPQPGPNGVITLTDPFFAAVEEPTSAVKVTDEEVGMVPYVSDAEKKRRADEEERRRKEAAANKDDAPERALMDMMDGTLEGKDELAQLAEGLKREEWMDNTPQEEWTPEQKAAMTAYNARLQAFEDEKARQRNALMSEQNKLVTELRDLVAAFDERVAALAKTRALAAATISAQEMYLSRLAMSVQVREDAIARDRALEVTFNSLLPLEETAAVAHETFKVQVASQTAAVEDLAAKDGALDKNFRENLRKTLGAIDSEVFKVLQGLFRKRSPPPTLPPPAPAPGAADAADPFAVCDVSGMSEEERRAAIREAALAPLTKADCPEGYGSLTDEAALWARLNELRQQKIVSELALAEATKVLDNMKAHLALLADKYLAYKTKIDNVLAERDTLSSQREIDLNDVEVLVRLKAGQDEVSANAADGTPHLTGGEPIPDLSDAILVPTEVVEAVNGDVRGLGGKKVGILTEIKDYRKNLLYMEWESSYLEACEADSKQYYRDLQLMRAAGPVREYLLGINVATKARQEVDKAEARLLHMKATHARNVARLHKTGDKLAAAVAERHAEVETLKKQLHGVAEGLALRENILATRAQAAAAASGSTRRISSGADATGSLSGTAALQAAQVEAEAEAAAAASAGDKMRSVAVRTKLANIAKAQASEINTLRAELEKLRERNFPSFPSGPSAPPLPSVTTSLRR